MELIQESQYSLLQWKSKVDRGILLVCYTVKNNPDEYPALAGLQRSLRIELDLYPADSHPARAG